MASAWAIPTLKDLVWDNRPDFIFLVETICAVGKVVEIKKLLGHDDCLLLVKEGTAGV